MEGPSSSSSPSIGSTYFIPSHRVDGHLVSVEVPGHRQRRTPQALPCTTGERCLEIAGNWGPFRETPGFTVIKTMKFTWIHLKSSVLKLVTSIVREIFQATLWLTTSASKDRIAMLARTCIDFSQ